MKKSPLFILLFAFSLFFVNGCSVINNFTNSIDYVTQATSYIQKMNDYANSIPPLLEDAVNNSNARQQLEQQLTQMKQDIEAFNKLNPPEFAQDIHNSIQEKNQTILDTIHLYQNNIKNGQFDPNLTQDLQLFQTVKDLDNLLNQLEKIQQ
jgi:hypothetical protein